MRRALALPALVLAAVATLPAGAASDGAQARAVLDVGDSLAVGTSRYLGAALPGYRIRRLHEIGLHAGAAAAAVVGTQTLPGVLVVSAGTNDDPRNVSAFRQAVESVVTAAGPHRCVVWPTIARPPAGGATYDRLNSALARLARRHANLVVVDWAALVRGHPAWLAADGVHVASEGYRARAAAIAAAIRTRCAARPA